MTIVVPMPNERRFYLALFPIAYAVWATYFLSMGHYAATLETIDLTTSLDNAIPVVPQMVWIYDLCYFLPLVPVFLTDGHTLNRLLLAIFFGTVAATLVYLLVPIAYPLPDFGSSLSGRFLQWQFDIDFQPGANKMPSLHVSNAFLIWLALRDRSKRTSWTLLCLAVIISLSTLFVKKHLVADVGLGFVWAFAFWWLAGVAYRRWADHTVTGSVALKKMLKLERS